MNARIGYLAILSQGPAKLAEFYTKHLGFRELDRSKEGDVTITDGAFNVSIIGHRPELKEPRMELGQHHIGIVVDNIAEVEKRYLKFNPRGVVVRESGDLQHGQARIYDPECNPVSLSENNFGIENPKAGFPRIAHVAFGALDPTALYEFYSEVFGFRELLEAHAESTKLPGYKNRHVGDGQTNVALQAFYNTREGHEGRHGIAHIGILTPDVPGLAKSLEGIATFAHRPASRVQSEIRMRDPEGNGCDLSGRGWEIDIQKWARADAA